LFLIFNIFLVDWQVRHVIDEKKIQQAIALLLEAVGEDVEREGLQDTPRRVGRMYTEIFSGLHTDPEKELEVYFTEDYDEMVIVKDISFYSMCEHHLVPFFGKAHVVYIPRKGVITGLSKLARVVEVFARRPQVQERMTNQIADLIMKKLDPLGVMVVIQAEHVCMAMRGVMKPGAKTVTSAVRGVFTDDVAARAEALSLIKD
jgi:GTP cyclohydrolase IA